MSKLPWNRPSHPARRPRRPRLGLSLLGTFDNLEPRTLLSRVFDLNTAPVTPDEIVPFTHPAYGAGAYFTMTAPLGGTDLFFGTISDAGTQSAHMIRPFPRSTRNGADLPRPDLDPSFTGADTTEGQVPSVSYLTLMNGTLYFAAEDAAGGNELWRSDGTLAGTVRLSDINPGAAHSNPEGLFVYNNKLYFSADDGSTGRELWRYDPATGATTQVADINPGAGDSNPIMMTYVKAALGRPNGSMIFGAKASTGQIHSLYSFTDGVGLTAINTATSGQTLYLDQYAVSGFATSGGPTPRRVEFPTIVSGGATLAVLPAGALRPGATSIYNIELWATDGTQGTATRQIIDFSGSTDQGTRLAGMVEATNNLVYFTAVLPDGNTYLYRTNASAVENISPGGAPLVTASNRNLSLSNFTAAGSRVFFTRFNTDDGSTQLWSTSGPGTTAMMGPISPPIPTRADAQYAPGLFAGRAADGVLFFVNVAADTGAELWRSDGTPSGTVLVRDARTGAASSGPRNLIAFNNTGTALDNQVLFAATPDGSLTELWRSNGTPNGTRRITGDYLVPDTIGANGNPSSWIARQAPTNTESSNPQAAVLYNNMVLFTASDGAGGAELYRTIVGAQGTVTTQRVKDIRPGGSSQPMSLTVYNGLVYFLVPGSDAVAGLWRTDGTEAGTVQVFQSTQISLQAPDMVVSQGRLFFTTYNESTADLNTFRTSQLWVSDGSNVALVRSFVPARDSVTNIPRNNPIRELAATSNRLYFAADDGVHGRELWVAAVNGAAVVTAMIKDINPFSSGAGDSNPANLTAVGSTLYFTADDGSAGNELWSTAGTEPSTTRYDIRAGASGSGPFSLIAGGGSLYFAVANSTTTNTDDAIYSATPGNAPQKRADVVNPSQLMYINGILLFSARSSAHGQELWRFDGTSASLLKDINDGGGDGMIGDYGTVVSDGAIYFAANTEYVREDIGRVSMGVELWRSDGTPEGTYVAHEFFIGTGSSYPRPLLAVPGNTVGLASGVFFNADDGTRGRELHYLTDRGPANDLTGDGKSEYSQYRPIAGGIGEWYTVENRGSTNAYVYDFGRQWGLQGDMPVPGDYDGDGKADYALFRPSDSGNQSAWYIGLNRGNGVEVVPVYTNGGAMGIPFGLTGDIAVPGDYDGDGRFDLAVYRPSNGNFYLGLLKVTKQPDGSYVATIRATETIASRPNAQPVTADFNGDGRADYGVYDISSTGVGVWNIILNIASGARPLSLVAYGSGSDIPVSGDFNGDGRSDLVVYRPNDPYFGDGRGGWYVNFNLPGNNPNVIDTFSEFDNEPNKAGNQPLGLGQPGDRPIAADLNGDGRSDFMLQRPNGRLDPFYGWQSTYYGVLSGRTGGDVIAGPTYDWARPLGAEGDWGLGRRPLSATNGLVTRSSTATPTVTMAAATTTTTTPSSSPSVTSTRLTGIALAPVSATTTTFDPFAVLRKRRLRGS
jgi:ELWxxDGT repeat protein